MCKNVKISVLLLDQIIELLKHWDLYEHSQPLCDVYDDVFWTLISIQDHAAVKCACNNILKAKSSKALDEAYAAFRLLIIWSLEAQEDVPF